jgi:hypothetical protein
MKIENRKKNRDTLHQRAEDLLKKRHSKINLNISETELLQFIHQLEVHEIELELQNEELLQAQAAAQDAAEKYIELFDFAPIGYLRLSKDGKLLKINLCAAQMLEKDRVNLQNSQFGFFVSDETKPMFNHFLNRVFTSKTKETCEVTLISDAKTIRYVSITGIKSIDESECLLTVMDITSQRRTEEELEKWAAIFKPKAN